MPTYRDDIHEELHDRLQEAACFRSGRKKSEWVHSEHTMLLNLVNRHRRRLGHTDLGLYHIARVERGALGHTDYMSKFSLYCRELIDWLPPSPLTVHRALTILQPWAWCICSADKRVENRSWRPPVMLPHWIAIHAGVRPTGSRKSAMQDTISSLRYDNIDVPDMADLSFGGILAVARIDWVLDAVNPHSDADDYWYVGPVGWWFGEVIALDEPLQCKGMQGLWGIRSPTGDDILLQQLRERIRFDPNRYTS